MFATCLFCHASLGANESIEHFPVGKRLAFDEAKGRLWVVCSKCERWNLSPIEERWEAIEEAERAYRDAKKRVTTDNVGLARLRDGTDLIRIGQPLRPEFAAWRYGDTFGKRRRKNALIGASIVVAGAGLIGGAVGGLFALSSGAIALSFAPQIALQGGLRFLHSKRRLTVVGNDGELLRVSTLGLQIASVHFHRPAGESAGQLMVSVANSFVTRPTKFAGFFDMRRIIGTVEHNGAALTGAAGEIALSRILAMTNRFSGSAASVRDAVSMVGEASTPFELLNSLSADIRRNSRRKLPPMLRDHPAMQNNVRISELPPEVRLALEMSLHEDSERRALDGELHELERRWKEAEEIAAIADSLTLSSQTSNRVDDMRETKS